MIRSLLLFPWLLAAGVSAQPTQAASPPSEPPLAREVLDSAWPTDAHELAIDSATLDQLGLHDDARRLDDAWQRREIAGLLGRAAPIPVTLRAAIAREATERLPLEQERSALAGQWISIDFTAALSDERPDPRLANLGYGHPLPPLVQLQKGLWGAFDEGVTGRPGREPIDAYRLLVRGVIRNRTTSIADLRIFVSLYGRAHMECHAKAVPPQSSTGVFCSINSGLYSQRAKAVEAAESLASGRMAPNIVGLSLDTGVHRPVLLVGEVAELDAPPRKDPAAVMAAKEVIARSGCRELGNCGRTAMSWIVNPGTVGMLIVAALMIWSIRRRLQAPGDGGSVLNSWFRGVFKCYFLFICLGIVLAMIDSPRVAGAGNPVTGSLSGLFGAALALPWSFLHQMQVEALPNAAMRDDTKREIARFAFFIVINFAYFGFMAYFAGPRRKLPRRAG